MISSRYMIMKGERALGSTLSLNGLRDIGGRLVFGFIGR